MQLSGPFLSVSLRGWGENGHDPTLDPICYLGTSILNSSPPSPFSSFLGFCPPPSPLGPPLPGAVGFRVTLIVGKRA